MHSNSVSCRSIAVSFWELPIRQAVVAFVWSGGEKVGSIVRYNVLSYGRQYFSHDGGYGGDTFDFEDTHIIQVVTRKLWQRE